MGLQVGVKTTVPTPDHDHSIAGEGGQIVEAAFADGALGGTKLTDASVPDAKISDVDGSKLVAASVGDAKISDVNGSKLVDGSVPDIKVEGLVAGDKLLQIPAADVTIVEAMTTPKVTITEEGA